MAIDSNQYEKVKKIIETPQYSKSNYFQILLKEGFILEANTDETAILKQQHLNALQESPIPIAIAPTLSCNFSCYYCYQDKENSYLSKEIADIIINHINHTYDNKEISIEWIGGEPLLNFEMMKYISGKIHPPFKSTLITNGYLIDKFIDEFENLNLEKVQITLDGNASTHNSIRFSENDKNTFEKIISNIHLFAEKYPQVLTVVRTNVKKTDEDEFDLKNFLSIFNDLKGKIRLNFSAILEKEVINGNEDAECTNDISLSFYEEILNNGFAAYKLPTKKITGSCSAFHSESLAISSNGTIHKCVGMLGTQNLILGCVNHKNIHIDENQAKNINTYDIFQNEKCTDCKIFPFCMGGCLNVQLRKQKETNTNSPCLDLKNNLNKAKSMISNYYNLLKSV